MGERKRWLLRDITDRKRAEDALTKAHDELEIRVQERTIALAQTNAALRAEIREHQRAEDEGGSEAVLLARSFRLIKTIFVFRWMTLNKCPDQRERMLGVRFRRDTLPSASDF